MESAIPAAEGCCKVQDLKTKHTKPVEIPEMDFEEVHDIGLTTRQSKGVLFLCH